MIGNIINMQQSRCRHCCETISYGYVHSTEIDSPYWYHSRTGYRTCPFSSVATPVEDEDAFAGYTK